MNEKEKKMVEEVEIFMKEVYSNPEVAEALPPANLHDKVIAEIRARELQKRNEKFTEEELELIKFGKLYKKRKRLQKYVVLAAVFILAFTFGITSIGGPEKLFEKVNWLLAGRKQINIDSDSENVTKQNNIDEEEIYERIEEKFGFLPVKIDYLPKGIGFVTAEMDEEIQRIYILYGKGEDIKISYYIRPNYREGSWGKDIEDELLDEYTMEIEDTEINLKQYLVENGVTRWLVEFEYENVSYSMLIMDLEQKEVEEIINNLYFF